MVTAVELTATKEPSLKAVNPLPALRHNSLITTIGSTPVIKLNRLAPEGVNVYVKAEALRSTLTLTPNPNATHNPHPHPHVTLTRRSIRWAPSRTGWRSA